MLLYIFRCHPNWQIISFKGVFGLNYVPSRLFCYTYTVFFLKCLWITLRFQVFGRPENTQPLHSMLSPKLSHAKLFFSVSQIFEEFYKKKQECLFTLYLVKKTLHTFSVSVDKSTNKSLLKKKKILENSLKINRTSNYHIVKTNKQRITRTSLCFFFSESILDYRKVIRYFIFVINHWNWNYYWNYWT